MLRFLRHRPGCADRARFRRGLSRAQRGAADFPAFSPSRAARRALRRTLSATSGRAAAHRHDPQTRAANRQAGRRPATARRYDAPVHRHVPPGAREDTALFPKLRSVVSADVFDAMAENFERDEHRKFGEDGFEMMVDRVARLERALGIYDLAKFTSR